MAKSKKIEEKNEAAASEELLSRKPKSGKIWKEKKDSRFSDLVIQNSQRTSWQKKMELKSSRLNLKKHLIELKEKKKQDKLDLLERQKRNRERKAENEKKMVEAAFKKRGAKKTRKMKIKNKVPKK